MLQGFLALILIFSHQTLAKANSMKDQVEAGLRTKIVIKNQTVKKYSLHDRMNYHRVPGVSVAVIQDGKIIWAKGYGVLDAGKSIEVTPKSIFQAGSISKSITALGALKLVRSGQLNLDKNVNDYLTSWKVPKNSWTKNEKVTSRRLLSHTAGLTVSGFPGYPMGTPIPTVVQILNGQKPMVNTDPVIVTLTPGSEWRYSGGGYTVLQQMIEDITHQPFANFMKDQILQPLSMEHSTFQQPLPENLEVQAASGHLSTGTVVPGRWNIYPELAAAGLWTNPTDLAKSIIFVQNCYLGHSDLLNKELCKEMLTPQKRGYGLGTFIPHKNSAIVFWHKGVDHGFVASWYGWIEPETGRSAGAAIMTNSYNGGALIDEIMASIADTYHWPTMRPIERTLVSIDPKIRQQYVGKYHSVEDKYEVEILEKEGSLYCKYFSEMKPVELLPESERQFFTLEGFEFDFSHPGEVIFRSLESEYPTEFKKL